MHDPKLSLYVQARMRYYLRWHAVKTIDMNLGPLGFLNTEAERQRQARYVSCLSWAERIEFAMYKSYHRHRLN